MHQSSRVFRTTINLMRGCLLGTIPGDLSPSVLEQLRQDLLESLRQTRVRRVILDCSGVEVIDDEDFAALRRVIAMAALMGARTVLAGLQPGVVSALVEMDVDLDGLVGALSVDDAFRVFGPSSDTSRS
jgi:rsbT antagonist protein RsbS